MMDTKRVHVSFDRIKVEGLVGFFTIPTSTMIAPIVSILTVALSFVQAQVGPERNCTAYDAVATDVSYLVKSFV